MKAVRRCWAWVEQYTHSPQWVSILDNGQAVILSQHDERCDAERVTEIPSAEWLRANEADFRELLEACHTFMGDDQSKWIEAWAVMRDIVDRRWRAKA